MNEKGKVFSLYYGQRVFKLEMLDKLKSAPGESLMDGDIMHLRSVSSLTDEECENAGELHDWHKGDPHNTRKVLQAMCGNQLGMIYEIADYLRSISIALPVTVIRDGKPYTLSVDEMVELGYMEVKGLK